MERIIHDLVQGSPEWHQFRLEHDGASEAAAMLGLSKKVTRNELLHQKHTGVAREFSDFVQERILDNGHVVEALARPLVETIIEDQLYPATYSYGRLSASCDGITMGGDTAFEHKQWAAALAESVKRGELPEEHQPQSQQVLHVTGAERLIFVVSDGTAANLVWMWVYPDPAWIHRIEAGWIQFHSDLDAYMPPEVIPAAVAAPQMALPALSIQVSGSIALTDNLSLFGSQLQAFVERINKTPQTDQDFADLEQTVKTLKTAEEALDAAESSALAQTASIDEMRRTVGLYRDLARQNRLVVEKLVKAEKENRRNAIIQGGKDEFAKRVTAINHRLGKPFMPAIPADFAGAIKGLKTLTSIQNAVDTELARATIEANEIGGRIQDNLNSLRELATDHAFLFADAAQLVLKANDDLVTLIKVRISEHKAAEEKRLEADRERIRQEEVAKLAAQQQTAPVVQQSAAVASTPATVTPVAKADPAAAVVDHQDEIARFLNERIPDKQRNAARAVLVEFVKWQSAQVPGRKAA
jgi:predicted phage-related endonuclease